MVSKASVMGAGTPAGQANALVGNVEAGKTATGTTRADAYLIAVTNTQFSTVAASTGAALPASPQPGDYYRVTNNGANTLSVYPQTGAAINNGAADAAHSVAANKTASYYCLTPTLWSVILSA